MSMHMLVSETDAHRHRININTMKFGIRVHSRLGNESLEMEEK